MRKSAREGIFLIIAAKPNSTCVALDLLVPHIHPNITSLNKFGHYTFI